MLISLHRQQTMSPGEMEIQLSSMSQQERTYQAIVTVVILVSMIHNLYSHVHVFVSHGTVYIHSYCQMSCQCDILNNLISSLLEYDKINFGDGVLFDSQNPRIEMQHSYKCDSARYFIGSGELTNRTINATLTVTVFQVQVFQFHNASTGTFDSGKLILTLSLYHVLLLLISASMV